jgi:hypothetical protein
MCMWQAAEFIFKAAQVEHGKLPLEGKLLVRNF